MSYQDLVTKHNSQYAVLLVNPKRSDKHHRAILRGFVAFVRTHPVYLQHYVLSSTIGKNHFHLQCEVLKDWVDSIGTKAVGLYQLDGDQYIHVGTTKGDLSDVTLAASKVFHKFFMNKHQESQKLARSAQTVYTYGKGQWTVKGTHTFSWVLPSTRKYVGSMRSEGKPFSPTNRSRRSLANGSPGLKSPRKMTSDMIIQHKPQTLTPWQRLGKKPPGIAASGISRLHQDWIQSLENNSKMKEIFWEEYRLVKDIVEAAGTRFNLWSLRQFWEMVFTTTCQDTQEPCGTCRQCSIRIAQAAIVVYAAQGVADENILPHLGAVFRSPRYEHFGVEEWRLVPVAEVATVLSHCSMQGQNALYIRDFLSEVDTNGVPRTLEDCLSFYGMLKKSACLFLGVVFHQNFGIPVDRHLVAAFINCGWVHPQCNSDTDPTLLSDMVECWLPATEIGKINNVVAGIRQLFQNSRFRAQVKETARVCGPRHLSMLQKITMDWPGMWQDDLHSSEN